MSVVKNPVEQRMTLLRDLWLQATEAPDIRLLVWRIPASADRVLSAFIELQQHAGDWSVPDFMLRMDADFDTGFGYSRTLLQTMRDGYLDSVGAFKDLGIPADWLDVYAEHPQSPAGVLAYFEAFTAHHRDHLRCFAPVLMPASVASEPAFEQWLDTALQTPVPASMRLVLVDHAESRRWQPLVDRHRHIARVIEADIDLFDIARETAAQPSAAGAASDGPATALRQMLTDVLTLVEKGTAAQAAARADRGVALAQRQQWPEQEVVLHMAVAGAHLKEQAHPEAIARYRKARDSAQRAEAGGSPVGTTLVMQSWFGEAGVWLVAKQPERASQCYVEGAQAARRVPNAMFAIEGLRMAGFCQMQAGRIEPAREQLLHAVGEARPMPAKDRAMTTLPLVLQDLLRLQDARRTDKLEHAAKDYQSAIAHAQQQAEKSAAKLGAAPAADDVAEVEQAMTTQMEAAFARLGHERERLIAGGDEFFRKVVAVGRDFLHPAWSGLPDVKHPLDKDLPEWSEPPAFALLPDHADLADTPATRVTAPDAAEELPA